MENRSSDVSITESLSMFINRMHQCEQWELYISSMQDTFFSMIYVDRRKYQPRYYLYIKYASNYIHGNKYNIIQKQLY